MDSNNNNTELIDYGNIRPWVRYWARYIDIYLLFMLVIIIQVVLFPTRQIDEITLAIGIYIIWILVEAQLMSTWGTTPGKWLLKTKVRDSNLNKLSLKTALLRGFLVWVLGLGLGVNLLSSITGLISYVTLKDQGITVWDKYCKCNVTHEKIGSERIPAILGVIILPIVIYSAVLIYKDL